jgi:menaquinone-dependent protoporphyrinogen IX oxidase
MARVLHTRKIATAMAGVLTGEGCRVDVVDAHDVAPDVRPDAYDGAIVTTRDYEYTDWNELRAFARTFARQVGAVHTTATVT